MSNLMLAELLATHARAGRIEWLGLRPARRVSMKTPDEIILSPDEGIVGDRYAGRSKKRQVTLINLEDLAAIGAFLREPPIQPARVRRNIVVSGINLNSLSCSHVRVGEAVLLFTGRCHPCSRMEEVLGMGGYNAMRGRGGWTAQVVQSGRVRLGDPVEPCSDAPNVGSKQGELFGEGG